MIIHTLISQQATDLAAQAQVNPLMGDAVTLYNASNSHFDFCSATQRHFWLFNEQFFKNQGESSHSNLNFQPNQHPDLSQNEIRPFSPSYGE